MGYRSMRYVTKALGVIVAGLLLTACNSSTSEQNELKPVNPDASQEARELLNFLNDISGKYVLSGQHSYTGEPGKWDEEVKKLTGKYPVVWGSDFGFNFGDKKPSEVRQNMIDKAIEKHEEGHIITLMWHACPPSTAMDCQDCSDSEIHTCPMDSIWIWNDVIPQSEWYEFTTPGTELNKNWRKQVDAVAGYLKQLQKKNIPVLWRPYHEMNGMWFWWCQHPGEQGFTRLWRLMYDRLVNHHNLDNLLWVWNPNAPRDIPGDMAFPYEHYFPGSEYVDVLAADVYNNDYRKSHHDDLLKLAEGKPIGFGEVGQLPAPEVLDEQPQWTWFMEWANWLEKANAPDSVKMLYDSQKVITLDEIERLEEGGYRVTPSGK